MEEYDERIDKILGNNSSDLKGGIVSHLELKGDTLYIYKISKLISL